MDHLPGKRIIQMTEANYNVVTISERPDLIEAASRDKELGAIWPVFMQHDLVVNRYWGRLFTELPEYQSVLLNASSDSIMALCNSAPLVWDDEPANLPAHGIDWALTKAFDDLETRRIPTTQCALAIAVKQAYRGMGLSPHAVKAMKSIGQRHGLDSLIAPVRPTLKAMYPLTPMERYIRWQREDGLPFDPWMRVHVRLGAKIVGVCPQSMTITGSVDEWETWTQMQFPETGPYVISGALVPVSIDCEADRGVYVEPNVWMRHPIA
jgi:hypothetical protein